jgi:hypothetical protein
VTESKPKLVGATRDRRWDRPYSAAEAAWLEMDEFLKRCEADGPPRTIAEAALRSARYLEMNKRCNDRVMEIFKGAWRDDLAHHLKVV